MLNRDLFLHDPATTTLPNLGVSTVGRPTTPEQWAILRYELTSFVCEGEYKDGLERILTAYLAALKKDPKQPGVWVSGFYGSGKSHLVRVLEALWLDLEFPDGATARGLIRKLPTTTSDLLVELSAKSKQQGGAWAAAGMLPSGMGRSVRMDILGIVFAAAGLPTDYAPARMTLWLMKEGIYDVVRASVEATGETYREAAEQMWVSDSLAGAILAAKPGWASSLEGVHAKLHDAFPPEIEDINEEKFLNALEAVLKLRATVPGKLPCTLIVLDETQQYLGKEIPRITVLQNVAEKVCTVLGSSVLLVATGQAQLASSPELGRLQDRFTVTVNLRDVDVEKVVREVVLQKHEDKRKPLQDKLDDAAGEIDRHLNGTKIAPEQKDRDTLVADYPLLPSRRRFWEAVLRSIDHAGRQGQLRTQLRMVHEANQTVAARPVGHVIPGDFIYQQVRGYLQQTNQVSRDHLDIVDDLRKPDGHRLTTLPPDKRALCARLCALVLLIGKLPTDGPKATGLRATDAILADLMVEDLGADGTKLREVVPALLADLCTDSVLMKLGEEYRLQTPESAAWEQAYQKRATTIAADDQRIATDLTNELRAKVEAALKNLPLTQGVNKTPRSFEVVYSKPTVGARVPIWVRDEWSDTEKAVKDAARDDGTESPIVHAFLPKGASAEAIRDALVSWTAANEVVEAKKLPPGEADRALIDAAEAMKSRLKAERTRLDLLLAAVLADARVYQSGGNAVEGVGLREKAQRALDAGVARLYHQFAPADAPAANWERVVTRVKDGSGDALHAVDHKSEIDKHPVCKSVHLFVGAAGKKGSDVRKRFVESPPYGWPKDAVNAALCVLVEGSFLKATRLSEARSGKELASDTLKIGETAFKAEGVTPTGLQKIATRNFCKTLGFPCQNPGEETVLAPKALRELRKIAHTAGGDAPLPPAPASPVLEELLEKDGNELIVGIADNKADLEARLAEWQAAAVKATARAAPWDTVRALLAHATLECEEVSKATLAIEAIRKNRSLLADPDPVPPVIHSLTDVLRTELNDAFMRYEYDWDKQDALLTGMAEWPRLTPEQQQQVRVNRALEKLPAPKVGDTAAIMASLGKRSLNAWEDQRIALVGRFKSAREDVIKLVQPKATRLAIPPKTIDQDDAEAAKAWLRTLEATLLAQIKAGPVVIE